jgi:hypothetical protein
VRNIKAPLLVVATLLVLQGAGVIFLAYKQQHHTLEITSLKAAFETEIRAREALQTELLTLKTTASQPAPPPSDMDSIFGAAPASTSPDVEQRLNTLKKQYEDVLVLHFFLTKCGKSTVQDFHTINSNLSQDMATINAPGRLQYDIMTAAKGSYDAIYASTSCEGEQAEASEKAFRTYIEQLANRNNIPTAKP